MTGSPAGAPALVRCLRSAVMSFAMRPLATGVVALLVIGGAAASVRVAPASPQRIGLYDANPNHLWNRIHEQFHVRVAPDGSQYGFDTVDPLLWRETRYLLTGPSHAGAVRVLDEFIASDGARLIRDPLKRAVFQHDLWAVFDWLASRSDSDETARSALMQRVARVMRRVALSRKEIQALPDSYAAAIASGAFADRAGAPERQPYLPRDFWSPTGPWVSVGGSDPLLPEHAAELGRSAFIVLWNLPGGSTETIGYLQRLWSFPQPFVGDETFQFARDGEVRAKPNPALPPVPDGTRIALVRKMLLIDDTGVIVPSNLVQSIQLRAFPSAFSELVMSREALFGGKSGGLRAVSADERDFITFSAQGFDPFAPESWRGPAGLPRVLDGCGSCHRVNSEPSILTVRSLLRMLRPRPFVDSRHERWARWITQANVAADAKTRSYEWGVLQGLWQAQAR
jgi:hypothetical protein